MSSLTALLYDYKEKLKIPFHMVTQNRTEKIFDIMVYCKEKDMNINE